MSHGDLVLRKKKNSERMDISFLIYSSAICFHTVSTRYYFVQYHAKYSYTYT